MANHLNTLENPRSWKKFLRWIKTNLRDQDSFDSVDWDVVVDRTLTFEEASQMVKDRFQGLWNDEDGAKPSGIKQIVFVKPLISKILRGEVKVTYRRTPKYGLYYAAENRFRPTEPKIIVEFYSAELVDADELDDDDARLAGVDSAEEIRRLFRIWYGYPIPPLYRNWFLVRSVGE